MSTADGTDLPEECEVLVVGAGPTGLAAAVFLEHHGVDVLCIDGEDGVGQQPKGNCVQSRSLEVLDILGLSGPLVEAGQVARETVSYFEGSPIFRRRFIDIIDDSLFDYTLWVDQWRVQREMLERLADSGRVHFATSFEALDRRDDRVVVDVVCRGKPQRVSANWVVGADGTHSSVRNSLGITRVGRDFAETWAMATVRLDPELPADEEMTFFARNEPALWVAPGPDGWVRLVTVSVDPDFDPDVVDERWFARRLQAVNAKTSISEVHHVGCYRVHEHLASSFREGRVLLAGDAAHEFTPLAGQGMNTGIQDGVNLAWKIAMVQSGRAALRLVDTYEEERQLAAASADKLTLGATATALELMKESWSQAATSEVGEALASRLRHYDYVNQSEIDLRYAEGLLCREWLDPADDARGTPAGRRIPTNLRCTTPDGLRSTVASMIDSRGFSALVVDPDDSLGDGFTGIQEVSAEFAGVLANTIRVRAVGDSLTDVDIGVSPEVYDSLTAGRPAVLLVRPDRYVGCRTSVNAAPRRIREFLRSIS